MTEHNNAIEIVLASDERYFIGLLVTAVSMARRASKTAILSYNILDGGLSEKSKVELKLALERVHENHKIQFVKLNLASFEGLPRLSGSLMTYARLLLPRLLPNAEFVLYCDVDFLWLADVADLWKLRDTSCALQSVLETYEDTLKRERAWASAHEISYPSNGYFCAGLCILNLNMFRKRKLDESTLHFLSLHHDVVFHDQSALNFSLSEAHIPVGLLPRKWQVFTHDVLPKDIVNGCALHFAGNTPWAPVSILTDAEILWFDELAMIRGVSRWCALRTIHSAFKIVLGRAIFEFATATGVSKKFFALILRVIGRTEGVPLLRPVPLVKDPKC